MFDSANATTLELESKDRQMLFLSRLHPSSRGALKALALATQCGCGAAAINP
jgi:hypothetical protein